MTPPRPPLLPRLVLGWLLPPDARRAVLSELELEYVSCIYPARGRARAWLWYWRQAAGSIRPALQMRKRRKQMIGPAGRWRSLAEGLRRDARYGWRYLRKRPAFAAAATLTLALGIGANTALFSIVDAIVLKPLPYEEPDRLVRIWSSNPRGIPRNAVSPPDFFDLDEAARGERVFEALAAFTSGENATLRGAGEPERIVTSTVSPVLFTVLGVRPVLGRPLTNSDSQGDTTPGVVVSHAFWSTRFGGSPSAVGRPISIDGLPCAIVGVMPAAFDFPSPDVHLWVPLQAATRGRSRSAHYLDVVGRLAPGVSEENARSVLQTVSSRLAAQHPASNRGWGITTAGLRESLVGDVRRPLLVLLATVGCVLLIACANVASLLLARGAARAREMAVRTALGASGGRLVGQQLVESGLLALLGAAGGIVLAQLLLQTLRGSSVLALPRLHEVGLDARAMLATASLALVTAVLTGVLPAVRTARAQPDEALKGSRAAGVEPVARRSRAALVVAQVGLSTALVIGAALLAASFARLTGEDAGFSADRVLLAQVTLSGGRYDRQGWSVYFERALENIRVLPGVVVAGAGAPLPLSGQQGLLRFGVRIDGRPDPEPGQFDRTYLRWATPGYFAAMGIPVIDGRTFEDSDRADARPVAVIDRTFAERYFPRENPIGRRVRATNDRTFREIVGVVGPVRQTSLAEPPEPHLYVAQAQNPSPVMTFVVRAATDPAALAASVREAVRRVDAEQPVFNVRTLDEVVAGSLASQRVNLLLMGLFAQLALALSLVGVYGLIAGWVTESTREIGVRMALGADRSSVYRLVFARGLPLAAAGVAIGLGLALAGTRVLAGMLYGVRTREPMVFLAASALVLVAAVLATWLPARRALAVDPVAALRAD